MPCGNLRDILLIWAVCTVNTALSELEQGFLTCTLLKPTLKMSSLSHIWNELRLGGLLMVHPAPQQSEKLVTDQNKNKLPLKLVRKEIQEKNTHVKLVYRVWGAHTPRRSRVLAQTHALWFHILCSCQDAPKAYPLNLLILQTRNTFAAWMLIIEHEKLQLK